MNHKESLYFRHLVLFNQAKTSQEKQEHYLLLRSLNGSAREVVMKSNQYDYFSKWYTVIIRELISLHDFQDDWNQLAKAVVPAIKPLEARQAVQLLLDLDMVVKEEDGTYKQKNKIITADDSITSMAVRSFSDSMLGLAKEALKSMPKQQRHISTMTIGISRDCYEQLKGEIQIFEDRVKTIVESDTDSSMVFQFSTQLFPVSREGHRIAGEVKEK